MLFFLRVQPMLAAFRGHQPPLLTATARQDQGQTLGDLQGFEIPLLPHGEDAWMFLCAMQGSSGVGALGS